MPIEYHIPVPIDEKPLSKVPYSVPYSLNYQSTIFTQFSTIYQYLLTKNHSVKSKKCTRNDHRLKSKLYIPHRTKKKKKMQNSLQQVNSTSRPITTSSITTVQSLHKNQTRIWMHNMGSHHLPKKHEATRRRPRRCLISNTSNNESTLLEAIKSDDSNTN